MAIELAAPAQTLRAPSRDGGLEGHPDDQRRCGAREGNRAPARGGGGRAGGRWVAGEPRRGAEEQHGGGERTEQAARRDPQRPDVNDHTAGGQIQQRHTARECGPGDRDPAQRGAPRQAAVMRSHTLLVLSRAGARAAGESSFGRPASRSNLRTFHVEGAETMPTGTDVAHLHDAFRLGSTLVELKSRIAIAAQQPSEALGPTIRLSSVWRSGFGQLAALLKTAFPRATTTGGIYEPP